MVTTRSKTDHGKALVVGGCGFLGKNLTKRLLQDGQYTEILAIDLNTSRNTIEDSSKTLSYREGNITSYESIKQIFDDFQPTVIFHTASPNPISANMTLFEKVNIGGTKILLQVAQETPSVQAFVYTSSASIIWNWRDNLYLADESMPVLQMPEQKEAYSHTKGIADQLVLKANRARGGFYTVTVRPSGIFGPGDPLGTDSFCSNAKGGKLRVQLGDNTTANDFTYVDNVVEGHVLAANKLLAITDAEKAALDPLRVDGEAFFITNGDALPFWDYARALGAAAGYPTDVKSVIALPAWFSWLIAALGELVFYIISFGTKSPKLTRMTVRVAITNRTFSIEKARTRLGYEPIVSLQDAIERSGKWWREQDDAKQKEKSD